MELIKHDEGLLRQPPMPNAPTVTVLIGGVEGGPDVGLVRVQVPPGAGMAAHRHQGSDVILTPTSGMVRITKGAESVDVNVGDSVLVGKDEAVALTNPGSEPADLLVAAGPANFVAGIRNWPEPATD
ncbi:cupin domain-containing protein [Paeniglutamicibacter antarcticus]|uniref:Cupin type-2 domain-containing protein n=1 Tax=Paeniglutamicibacter antarcticus TaxID=494023 RepID=A0ABP9TM69_9MICC